MSICHRQIDRTKGSHQFGIRKERIMEYELDDYTTFRECPQKPKGFYLLPKHITFCRYMPVWHNLGSEYFTERYR